MRNPFLPECPMNQENHPKQLFAPPSQRDHYQGMLNAPVMLVEYGNYSCPQCKKVHQLIQAIQQHFDVGFPKKNWICVVFRHFVQNSTYPQAQKAAQAAAAAAAQGRFWQMHDMLFTHSQALGDGYLVEYADILGLDISQFLQDLSHRVHVDRINQDTESGLNSGVTSAPALFINGIRYRKSWSKEQLIAAIIAASH
ncbi:DsbA family protein [Stenomitos frigidus AS-A4]|uniref:DsbA family protein n=2 Tax=Stenomitos TaxID=1844270 RepID=A0ABV0KMK6_9CYAN|nr:DsbA family protein [Phormidium sp. FACHB-592]